MFAKTQQRKDTMKPFSVIGNYKEQALLSVMKAEGILSHVKVKNFLKRIEQNTYLNTEQFNKTYIQLVRNFAEFVQAIPTVEGGELGSLFAEGLHRALFAIESISQSEEEQDALFNFAIFSSALLLDLRKIFVNRRIFICNQDGEFVSEWLPFKGSMLTQGAEFYKIRIYQRPIENLSPYISLLLAYKIMPEAAFLWLTSDLRILNMWVAALSGDEEGSGGLAHYLKIAKERLELIKNPNFILPVEITTPEKTEMGEAFWNWLKNNLSDGSFDAGIYNVKDYIFIDADRIFKQYASQYGLDWQAVQRQFLTLGIAVATQEKFDPKQPEKLIIYFNRDEITPTVEKNLNEAAGARKSFFNTQNAVQIDSSIKTTQNADASNFRQGFVMAGAKWAQISDKVKSRNKTLIEFVDKIKERSKFHDLDHFLEKSAEENAKQQAAQIYFSSSKS